MTHEVNTWEHGLTKQNDRTQQSILNADNETLTDCKLL